MKQLTDNRQVAIHCPTRELAEKVLKKLDSLGYTWPNRARLINNGAREDYKKRTCYFLEEDNTLTYMDIVHAESSKEDYVLLSAEDYLSRKHIVSKQPVRYTYEVGYKRNDHVYFEKDNISFDNLRHSVKDIKDEVKKLKDKVQRLQNLLLSHSKLKF